MEEPLRLSDLIPRHRRTYQRIALVMGTCVAVLAALHVASRLFLSALTTDGSYLGLRGNLAFRKAVENYMKSERKDPQVLEEALLAAEDNMRNALKANSDNWDSKYNYEYVNYIRNLLTQSGQGKMNILMENVRPKEIKRKPLTPEQMG